LQKKQVRKPQQNPLHNRKRPLAGSEYCQHQVRSQDYKLKCVKQSKVTV